MTRTLAITIALLLAAPPAVAEDLKLAWRTLTEYDSNASGQGGGKGDFVFTFGPLAALAGEYSRFHYQIQSYTAYEKYVVRSQRDHWRQDLSAHFRLDVSPRIRLDVSDNFHQLPQLRNSNVQETDVANNPPNEPNLSTGRVISNVFTTSLSTAPLPRLGTTSQVSVIYRDLANPTLNAQNTLSTTVLNQARYQWSESHSTGLGFRYSTRDYQTLINGDPIDATTQTFEGFASWVWEIDARTSFSARAGPAWTVDDLPPPDTSGTFQRYPTFTADLGGVQHGWVRNPASCPPENARPALGGVILTGECLPVYNQDPLTGFPLGITGPQLDALLALQTTVPVDRPSSSGARNVRLFFALSLDHRWDRASVSASWVRSDSQTQSLGSGTLVDSFLLSSNYDLTSRLHFNASFRFVRRFSDVTRQSLFLVMSETPEDIPAASLPGFDPVQGFPIIGTSTEDTSFQQTRDTYAARFSLRRQLGRYSSGFVGFYVRRYQTDFNSQLDQLDFTTTTNAWEIQLGFTYRFRPLRI
jgi:hypothetical protein